MITNGNAATIGVEMNWRPVQRIQPWPEALALLESLGAKNNHKCVSC